MKYFLILFLMCSVVIFPTEKKKQELVVKPLVPDAPKKKTATGEGTVVKDPFWDLIKNRPLKEDKLESFSIGEVKLVGIVRLTDGQYKALLVSPKGKSFIASVGQKLYDGEIAEITIEAVSFKKVLPPALPK